MKKYFLLITGVLFLLMLAACSARAQYAKGGIVELGGSISFSSSTLVANGEKADEATTIFQFMPYMNYFLVDGFSIGLLPGINIIKVAGAGSSVTTYALFLAPGFTFATGGNIYPYIEGIVGYTGLTAGEELGGGQEIKNGGLSFGGKAGIKIAAGSSGLASIGVSYLSIDVRPKGADERTGMNNLAVTAGYSIFF